MARGRPSKKQLILDTARELFAKTGYQGTSIDLVVKEAAVSKPTIYNNFPTKQALLYALMQELLDESQDFQKQLFQQQDLSAKDAIIALFEWIANTPAFLAVYRICYGEQHKLEAETYALFQQFDQAYIDAYREWLISQGIKLSDAGFLTVIAICREGILVPALSGHKATDIDVVRSALALALK